MLLSPAPTGSTSPSLDDNVSRRRRDGAGGSLMMDIVDRCGVCKSVFSALSGMWDGGSLSRIHEIKARLWASVVILLLIGALVFHRTMVLSSEIYDEPAVDAFFATLAASETAATPQLQSSPLNSGGNGSCWQPNSAQLTADEWHRRLATGSVIITVANFHHVGLALMQFRRLGDGHGGAGCTQLTRAVVAVDTYVSDLCSDLGFRNCVLGTRSNVGPSDFGRSSYNALTYLKWRVARSALLSFDNVLFFDSDVVVLRNPWPPLAPRLGSYDLHHQAEALEAEAAACEQSSINGGQLVFQKGARPLIECVLDSEQKGLTRVLDQDFVRPCADKVRARTCSLNQTQFNGFCVHNRLGEARVLDTVAFHAHCLGNFHHKRAAIAAMLAAVEAAEGDPAQNSKLSSVRWLGVRNKGGVPPRRSAGLTDPERIDKACMETVGGECRRKGNMGWIPELAHGA